MSMPSCSCPPACSPPASIAPLRTPILDASWPRWRLTIAVVLAVLSLLLALSLLPGP